MTAASHASPLVGTLPRGAAELSDMRRRTGKMPSVRVLEFAERIHPGSDCCSQFDFGPAAADMGAAYAVRLYLNSDRIDPDSRVPNVHNPLPAPKARGRVSFRNVNQTKRGCAALSTDTLGNLREIFWVSGNVRMPTNPSAPLRARSGGRVSSPIGSPARKHYASLAGAA